MSRPSKDLEDYQNLAKLHNLKFLGEEAPSTVIESVPWKCLKCGRITRKCYNKVKFGSNSCRCQSKLSLKEEDYDYLADSLNLLWLGGDFFPKTNKQKTLWKTHQGTTFLASYHELAYHNIPFRLREIIDDQ